MENNANGIHVFVNLDVENEETLKRLIRSQYQKVIIFGRFPECLFSEFGVVQSEFPDGSYWIDCEPAPQAGCSETTGKIAYNHPISNGNWVRPLCRFDYSDEWNNLGYGRITRDGAWGLASSVLCHEHDEVASLKIGDKRILSFMSLFDREFGSLLWINRPVGTVDGPDWRIVEDYICDFRGDDLPCCPVISEVPFGFRSAVTMRLDCDEDIQSAEPLMELYRQHDRKMSLAITTSLLDEKGHHATLMKLLDDGGGLLSHSHSHSPRWGGNYEAAYNEAKLSKRRLLEVTGMEVNHAVAPFHHTPGFALDALEDCGYTACVGGIINCDPEFLILRSGKVATNRSLVGHVQQTMFHGYTLANEIDPLKTYKDSFELSRCCNSWFGYLDHPISERYAYDWVDEQARLDIHDSFLDYLGAQDDLLFTNENVCLDFLICRSKATWKKGEGLVIKDQPPEGLEVSYRLNGFTKVAGRMQA